MRIAHMSDLHLLDLSGASLRRFLNKRITGYVNLRLKRGHHHKPAPVHAAERYIRELGVDHVAITGDVSNLALEREFERVIDLVEDGFGLDASNVSMVPGNHDAYTRGAFRSNRFAKTFAKFMTSDLPFAEEDGFPFVRLRGPAAIIGLSTARARPPLMASGSYGKKQLDALRRMLEHPEVRSRTPVILQHHPLVNPPSFAKTALEGLWDGKALTRALAGFDRGLVLHGHLHRRIHRRVPTTRGHLDSVGATSASLLHEDLDRHAGFNVYDIADDGSVEKLGAFRLSPDGAGFEAANIPTVSG